MSLKRDEDYEYSENSYNDDGSDDHNDRKRNVNSRASNKRQRIEPVEDAAAIVAGIEFDDIDTLALDRILGFLDVKSLFRFAFTSSRFREVVTHEHVVRSALISGGHAKKTITDVIEMALTEKTAFLPSPLRLLRLANGRRCEHEHCSILVHHIRPGYGLFFCWNCLVQSTTAVKHSRKSLKVNRLAQSRYSKQSFYLTKPYTDTSSERAGPILSLLEARGSSETIDQIIQAADDAWTQQRRDSILQCLKKATEDHANIERLKEEAKGIRKNTKKVKAKAFVNDLQGLMSGDSPYLSTVLEYRESLRARKSGGPSLIFAYKFVDETMRPLVLAPSKATKKKLREIANYFKDALTTIETSGFLDFSFMGDDKTVNPWTSMLQKHLRTAIIPRRVLKLITNEIVTDFQQGRIWPALTVFEGAGASLFNWVEVFVEVVTKKNTDEIPNGVPRENVLALAKRIYIDMSCSMEFDFEENCTRAACRFQEILPSCAEWM